MIVANTTYRIAPWADALFAIDQVWWDTHIKEVNQNFKGARFTTHPMAKKYHAIKVGPIEFKTYGNSGAGCISLAAQGNAKRIILLGFDSQRTGGKTHWHGDHPPHLGNAGAIPEWAQKFADQARDLSNIEILNCSRETALTCYPRATLESVL